MGRPGVSREAGSREHHLNESPALVPGQFFQQPVQLPALGVGQGSEEPLLDVGDDGVQAGEFLLSRPGELS